MHHEHRVPQAVGDLGQTELEAAFAALHRRAQVAVEGCVPQHVGEAVVLIVQAKEVAKARLVRLAAFLEVLIARQQADGRAAVEVKLGAVVETKSWEVSRGCPGVFGIVEMCSVWRTFLESRINSKSGCVHTSRRGQGTLMEADWLIK